MGEDMKENRVGWVVYKKSIIKCPCSPGLEPEAAADYKIVRMFVWVGDVLFYAAAPVVPTESVQ